MSRSIAIFAVLLASIGVGGCVITSAEIQVKGKITRFGDDAPVAYYTRDFCLVAVFEYGYVSGCQEITTDANGEFEALIVRSRKDLELGKYVGSYGELISDWPHLLPVKSETRYDQLRLEEHHLSGATEVRFVL